jgi:uncharacterized membrane protein
VRPGLVIAILLGPLLMALLGLFAQGAAAGRFPRNHLIGIRLPSTQASDAAWRAGHRAAIAPSWVCCGALVVVDVVAVLVSRSVPDTALAIGVLVLLLAGIVWIAVTAASAARRAG